MRPGDIGLVRIRGTVGVGIRFGQWLLGDGFHNYEHAFVYVGNNQLVEAEPGGAILSTMDRYSGESILTLECPNEYRLGVAEAARGFIGVPYSFLDYGSLALRRFHVPTPHLRRYIETSGHMICSQLCDRAAELGGWHLFDDGRWHGDVTPGDLTRLALRGQTA